MIFKIKLVVIAIVFNIISGLNINNIIDIVITPIKKQCRLLKAAWGKFKIFKEYPVSSARDNTLLSLLTIALIKISPLLLVTRGKKIIFSYKWVVV